MAMDLRILDVRTNQQVEATVFVAQLASISPKLAESLRQAIAKISTNGDFSGPGVAGQGPGRWRFTTPDEANQQQTFYLTTAEALAHAPSFPSRDTPLSGTQGHETGGAVLQDGPLKGQRITIASRGPQSVRDENAGSSYRLDSPDPQRER